MDVVFGADGYCTVMDEYEAVRLSQSEMKTLHAALGEHVVPKPCVPLTAAVGEIGRSVPVSEPHKHPAKESRLDIHRDWIKSHSEDLSDIRARLTALEQRTSDDGNMVRFTATLQSDGTFKIKESL